MPLPPMNRYPRLMLFLLVAMSSGCDDSEHESERSGGVAEPEASREAVGEPDPECAERAAGAVMALKRSLVSRLVEAMAESSAAAVEVCSHEAEAIRARVQQETGVEVGRASSRVRNAAANGNPPAWVRSYLSDQVGETEAVEWSQHASGEFRLVSPLITGELCLTCHGEEIETSILAAIDERYADDEARGYQSGDLRGVVWARAECEQE